jgi:coproporphyrinogen III oxidase
MSLPPHVQWVYDHPEVGSEEEKFMKVLENPVGG